MPTNLILIRKCIWNITLKLKAQNKLDKVLPGKQQFKHIIIYGYASGALCINVCDLYLTLALRCFNVSSEYILQFVERR